MELIELHVGQRGAGLCGQRDAVAGGHGGVGGVGINLARATRGHQHRAGADALQNALWAAIAVEQIGPNHAAVSDNQVGDRGPLGKVDALVGQRKSRQRAADFSSRGIAIGVQNAGQGVRALASAQQLAAFIAACPVKVRAPLNQLGHAHRPLGHQNLGRGTIDQPIASVDRVFQMQRDVLVTLHGDGDAALRIVRVGLGH